MGAFAEALRALKTARRSGVKAAGMDVVGAQQIKHMLKGLPKNVQAKVANKAYRKAGQVVLKQARSLAPVREGRLKKGLILRRKFGRKGHRRNSIGVVVRTKPRAHFGIPPEAKYFYPAAVELGIKNMAAQSYLRAALDAKRAEVWRILKSEIRAGVPCEAKKLAGKR